MTVNQDEDNPAKRTITARLIDGSHALDEAVHASFARHKGRAEPHPDFEKCMMEHQGHHKHQGEIQIFDGTNDTAGLVALADGQNIDIVLDAENRNYVRTELSYDKFMPKLGKIAANAKMAEPGNFNSNFVSNTVTINRGVVRVREVGDWDAGSITIPANYRGEEDRDAVYQPAKVRFLKANVFGYVATECVVDVEDAKSVTIAEPGKHGRTYTGNPQASRRAAVDTVEVLITNYAPQQSIALPWTLHYRWMFEAAGYGRPIDLSGPELEQLAFFGQDYDLETWVCESEMFLGSDGKTGYPFPYRTAARGDGRVGGPRDMWIVRLGDLDYGAPFAELYGAPPQPEKRELVGRDPWDPVRCPMGDSGGK